MITIDMPLPNKAEHPNKREHWAVKSKAKRKTRGDAKFATLHAIAHHDIKLPIANPTYKAEFRLPRKQDEDNLIAWIKAQIDGMADAKLFVNDGELKLDSVEIKSGYGATGGKFGVRYTIWSRG